MICCAQVSPDLGTLPGPGAAVHWKALQKVLASVLYRGRGRKDGRERRGWRGGEGFERLREKPRSAEPGRCVPLVLQLKVDSAHPGMRYSGSGFKVGRLKEIFSPRARRMIQASTPSSAVPPNLRHYISSTLFFL